MKIFVSVPTFETIHPETFKTIYGLNQAGGYVVFDYMRGYDCATARNNIGEQTLAEGADYLLMVDSDMVLYTDILVHMLEDPKDVCLGICPIRNYDNVYDGQISAYKLGEFDYVTRYTADEIAELRDKGEYKVKIHGGGMACALIKADVFTRIPFPWFKAVTYDNKTSISEDLYFCEQCHANNIDVYMDTRACVGHVFRHVQWP